MDWQNSILQKEKYITKYITSNTENFKIHLEKIMTFLIIQYKSTLNLHLLYRSI